MEIHLLYQSNINSIGKPYSFLLFNDQLMFNKSKKQNEIIRSLHISSLSFAVIRDSSPILSVDVLFKHEKLFISSELNSMNTLNSFRKVLGYLKHLYFLNLSYAIFIHNQLRYFSPKEYTDKLCNYINKYTFYGILKRINETNDLKGMFKAISIKFENYEEDLMPVFTRKKIDMKQSMMTDFKNTFMTLYNNLSINPDDYGRKSEIILDPMINLLSKKYYDLTKILLEIRNSTIEACISKDYQILMKNDIMFFYCLLKTKTVDVSKLKTENETLNTRRSITLQNNQSLKKELIKVIEEKGNQMYYCLKCGLMLFKTDITNSNCRYDDKCTKYSMFYCRKCSVAYCTYCVSYYKDSKCPYNHLLFEFEIKSNQICAICFKSLSVGIDIAGCKICQLPICNECNKTRASIKSPSCQNCSYSLGWKRGRITKCSKCQGTKECFWFCFFCSTQICIQCQPTINDRCGLLHKMTQKGFNDDLHREFYSYLDKQTRFTNINVYMNDFHCQPNILCSKCNYAFPEKFNTCLRCSYILCQSCVKEQS